jgi:hypothetical protein
LRAWCVMAKIDWEAITRLDARIDLEVVF